MKVEYRNIVTGSAGVGPRRASWDGASSPAVPFFTKQGRAKWWPHEFDKGIQPEKHIDRPINRAPLKYSSPLRLRGGADDDLDVTDGQASGHITVTPTNGKKRKAGDSPPGAVPDSISSEVNAIDTLVSDCREFVGDMITSTKIGRKWIASIEDFLGKIQACSTNIALEAAVIAGKYQEVKLELKEANSRLMVGSYSDQKQPKRLYVSAVKGDDQTQDEDDVMIVEVPNNNKLPVKDRLGDFPQLERQVSKNSKRSKRRKRGRIKSHTEKMIAAKNKPVKPAFLVEGKEGSVNINDIWSLVSKATKAPKVDGCRKNANGDFVLTSTDESTMNAIRSISHGLSIRELGPRKPRVRIKGIPVDYSPEAIKDMILKQNHGLSECSADDIRPLFKCGKRDEHITDWVIEVSPKLFKLINGKRTYVGMVSTFPRPFTAAPHCRRCLRTSHKTTDCKEEAFTCFHCAKPGHNRANCPHKKEKPTCAQCNGEHVTLSKDCATWAAKVRALQLKTSYE